MRKQIVSTMYNNSVQSVHQDFLFFTIFQLVQHLPEFPSQQSASRMTGEVFLLLLNWLLFSVSVYWLEQGTLTRA